MEKKLAEYKCDTNEAISLKVGMCYLLPSYYCDPLKKKHFTQCFTETKMKMMLFHL